MEASRNRMFPVGLYAVLLAGLFGVTFPSVVAPLESFARTVVCLPLRAYSMMGAEAAHAAGRNRVQPSLGQELAAEVLTDALGPPGRLPQVCRVREQARGPLGQVDALVLDARVAELAGASRVVTVGDVLVGFLDLDGAPNDRARVRLLSFRGRRDPRPTVLTVRARPLPIRVAAQTQCEEVDAQGMLRFLVEPARSVDPWRLRCVLLDDSYLASRMRRSGGAVTTVATDTAPDVPAGLRIGRLMVWGYPERDIPVGLFVEPALASRSLSSVVVWRPAGMRRAPRLKPEQVGAFSPVRLSRYKAPRPAGERWLVTAAADVVLPDGAALVDRGRFLGRLRSPWTGQSLVTPLGVGGGDWAFVLRRAPGDTAALSGRIVGRTPRGALRLALDRAHANRAGELFTGCNGRHCPAGLYVGRARPGVGDELLIEMPTTPVGLPTVFVADERPVATPRKDR